MNEEEAMGAFKDVMKDYEQSAPTAQSLYGQVLNLLCDQQRDYGHRVGWEANTHGEGLMLIVTELVEAMEDVRMGLDVTKMHFEGDKPCGVPSEMADVILRVATFCGFRGIDLGAAVEAKLRYNETRGFRHGGKIL